MMNMPRRLKEARVLHHLDIAGQHVVVLLRLEGGFLIKCTQIE